MLRSFTNESRPHGEHSHPGSICTRSFHALMRGLPADRHRDLGVLRRPRAGSGRRVTRAPPAGRPMRVHTLERLAPRASSHTVGVHARPEALGHARAEPSSPASGDGSGCVARDVLRPRKAHRRMFHRSTLACPTPSTLDARAESCNQVRRLDSRALAFFPVRSESPERYP
jgi:hypothetical protein